MKLNWRAWQALATKESVDRAKAAGVKQLPAKVVKAAKPQRRNSHKDGPHSSN